MTHDTARVGIPVSGWLLAAVSAASFGLSGAVGRGVMDAGWSAAAAVAVRVLLGAAVLIPVAVVQLRGRWHLVRRNLPLMAVYGAVPVAGCQLAYFTAVKHVPVGVALLIEFTAPVAVVGWLWLRRGERPTRLTVVGAALGVQLAVDDFGTGYSSLSYLRRFPVDILKVDQSFVSGLGHDPEDSAIVQAVVHMGRALQLTTVAEGVETAHQLIELRELECDVAQGYHFARPTTAESVKQLLVAGTEWLRLV